MTMPPTERTRQAEEPFPDHHNDLAATLKVAWQMIARGTHDKRSAFNTPVLSTQSADGPQSRVWVLRAFDLPTRTLTFHTDLRSEKIIQLAADSHVALNFYDAARKVQIRINGVATVHSNCELSRQRWQASRPSSLRCFAGASPGAMSLHPTSGLPAHLEGREPERSELAEAESNFAVVTIATHRLEWLHLHTRGQRRALFVWTSAADCVMSWLNP